MLITKMKVIFITSFINSLDDEVLKLLQAKVEEIEKSSKLNIAPNKLSEEKEEHTNIGESNL